MEQRAAMSTASINDLPDSAFAYIEPGGTKDASGKTTPRSKRHFPVHDAAHTRNALARLSSSPFGAKAKAKVHAAARKFGIQVSDDGSTAQDRAAFELRKRRRSSMIRQIERRGLRLEVRAKPDGTGGTDFLFEGYGAVFDAPFGMWDRWGDPYTEVVKPGAFSQTLRRPDLDVPFLIGHDDKQLAMARTRNGTMQLAQDSHGLEVRARMDGRRSDVRNLAYAVERGDQDEMSIGFVTVGQEWSPDYEERSMLDLDLHRGDVSSVPLAANPAAAGATMSAFPAESLSRQAAERRAAMNAAADQDTHDHPHRHDGDADHDHHDEPDNDADDLGSRRPLERRGNPVDQDLGDAADYDVYTGPLPHAPVTTRHSHPHPSYGDDALVTINNDGVPAMEESQGAAASLALARSQLETRQRQLQLLRLGGRNG